VLLLARPSSLDHAALSADGLRNRAYCRIGIWINAMVTEIR
jgi:hypothetical protein